MGFGGCNSKHNMSVSATCISVSGLPENILKARSEAELCGNKMKEIKYVIKIKLLQWLTVQSSEQSKKPLRRINLKISFFCRIHCRRH